MDEPERNPETGVCPCQREERVQVKVGVCAAKNLRTRLDPNTVSSLNFEVGAGVWERV